MSEGLAPKKKTPALIKPIKVEDYRELFKAMAGVGINAATLRWPEFSQSLVSTAAAMGIETTEDEILCRLLTLSMQRAIYDVLVGNLFSIKKPFDTKLDSVLAEISGEYEFDAGFFSNPVGHPFVKDIQQMLRMHLEFLETEPTVIDAVYARLPAFFVYALNAEWRDNHDKYQRVIDYFDTPFMPAVRRERDWSCYAAWLNMQLDEPIFGGAFSLRQLYVEPCAYYKERPKNADTDIRSRKPLVHDGAKRMVVKLEEQLENWLKNGDKDDAIRVISGGPGSGKSSFAKMFAARQAAFGRKVLYIPLHLIDLDRSLDDAIKGYLLAAGFFDTSPYGDTERLLIIFDGLDELSQQGKAGMETAKQFADTVTREVSRQNFQLLKLQVLLTGRELSVQSTESLFRKQEEIFYLLPYFVSEQAWYYYIDKAGLLAIDKRNVWWKKYGKLSKLGYSGLPKDLENDQLDELTAEPLLNYLVALSYDNKYIDFSKETNMVRVSKLKFKPQQKSTNLCFGRFVPEISFY